MFWFHFSFIFALCFFPIFLLFPPPTFSFFLLLAFSFLLLFNLVNIFPLFSLPFHALTLFLGGRPKKFSCHRTMGVYRMATKKLQSPSNLPPSLDGNRRILITIRHTHTIKWQPKFFGRPRGKMGDEFFFSL